MRTPTTTILLVAAALAAVATPAHAREGTTCDGPAESFAFVWANRPTASGRYTAPTSYSYSSAGGSLGVTRTGVGRYTVDMPAIGASDGGNVQVTGYGDATGNCGVASWYHNSSTGRDEIRVHCWNGTGADADSKFAAWFHRLDEGCLEVAYGWVDLGNTTSGPLHDGYTWSPFPWLTPPLLAMNSAIHDADGVYRVSLRLQDVGSYSHWDRGVEHVTAYGWSSTGVCSSSLYTKEVRGVYDGDEWVSVNEFSSYEMHCAAPDGSPYDTRLSVWHGASDGPGSTYGANIGHVAVGATGGVGYLYNSAGGNAVAVMSGTGLYVVTLRNLASGRSTVQVTAKHADRVDDHTGLHSCRPVSWRNQGVDAQVTVACRDGSGARANSMFHLSYVGL